MSYDFVTSGVHPHLGGNIYQGDPCTFAPTVWKYLIDRFAISSVLDLGSGRGHAAEFFHRSGMKVIAVDGLMENVSSALFPTVHLDLTKNFVSCEVDLVHCQEVAEHILPEYVENFISSLACGEVVVMSHATPGQDGHHHVNCQTWDYWDTLMRQQGYALLPIDTQRVRDLAEAEGAIHLARSALVFSRRP